MSYTPGYEGDTVASVPHGQGSYAFPNPHFRYQGDFKQGVPHGRGVLTFGDGGSYDGEFVDGGVLQAPPPLAAQNDRPRREPEIEGQGVRRWASGATYVGSFHCGEFDGNGTLTSPSGYRYEGQWKLNQHHGRGVWERADGTVFEGGFHHHEPHGRCVERGPDGEVRDGEWRHGRLHGHALWRGADGSWYEGEWENGLRHGHGRGYDAVSGVEYLGPFRDDAPVDVPKQVDVRLGAVLSTEDEEKAEGKEEKEENEQEGTGLAAAGGAYGPGRAEALRCPTAPIELSPGAVIPDVAAFCARGGDAGNDGGGGPPDGRVAWESGRVLEVRLIGPFTTDEELAAQQAEAEAAAKGKGKSKGGKGKGKKEEEEKEEGAGEEKAGPPEESPAERAATLASSLSRRHVYPLVVERQRARFPYRFWEEQWRVRDPEGAAALDERVQAAEAAAKAKASKKKDKGQPEEAEEPAPDPEAGCVRVECVHARTVEGQARFPSLRLPHDLLPGRYALHVREVVVRGGVAAEQEGEERWQSVLAAAASAAREKGEQEDGAEGGDADADADGHCEAGGGGQEAEEEKAEGKAENEESGGGRTAGEDEDPIAALPPPYAFDAGALWAAEVEIHVES